MGEHMEMTMKTRRELVKVTTKRYQKAGRKKKAAILDEFCESTQYNRDYAATLLRLGVGLGHPKARKSMMRDANRRRTGRPMVYDQDTIRILALLWRMFDQLCSKRLVPLIRNSMASLQGNALLRITPGQAHLLTTMSAATADRLLAKSHASCKLHGHCYTRPNGGLKESIPVRTFGEWQDCPPGHCQVDTVGHDGGILSNECSFTLCLTDIYSGWTERFAMQNRAFKWVRMGLGGMMAAMPFPLRHLHPDNGSEFINYGLVDFCKNQNHVIELSRSRAGKKNDNCHVEQKNFDTIRKLVGYARYSTQEMLVTLNELYAVHGLLLNYFYPSQKLVSKERIGSKVKKAYDHPQSPADRLLGHPDVEEHIKLAIRTMRQSLDPMDLSARVDALSTRLLRLLSQQGRKEVQQAGGH